MKLLHDNIYLSMFCNSIEEHCDNRASQTFIVATKSMYQQSGLIRIDVVLDLLI